MGPFSHLQMGQSGTACMYGWYYTRVVGDVGDREALLSRVDSILLDTYAIK